jgi:hypothetical protein
VPGRRTASRSSSARTSPAATICGVTRGQRDRLSQSDDANPALRGLPTENGSSFNRSGGAKLRSLRDPQRRWRSRRLTSTPEISETSAVWSRDGKTIASPTNPRPPPPPISPS